MTASLEVRAEVVEDGAPEVLSIDLVQAARTIESLRKAGVIETTGISLTLTDPNLSYARFEALGKALGLINRSCAWWLGDWLLFGDGSSTIKDRIEDAMRATGLAEQTLSNRASICRQIPPSRRLQGVSFSVHAEVAYLPPKSQTFWLERAAREGWTTKELRKAMKKSTERAPADDELDDETPDLNRVVACVRRLLRNCEEAGENVICRREDIVQLRAAFGEEPA